MKEEVNEQSAMFGINGLTHATSSVLFRKLESNQKLVNLFCLIKFLVKYQDPGDVKLVLYKTNVIHKTRL